MQKENAKINDQQSSNPTSRCLPLDNRTHYLS